MGSPITVIGNLTDDPELRFTPSGHAVCNFTVAVNERIRDADGNWKDGETSYFRCAAWRNIAENCAESLTKGSNVIIHGTVRTRAYDKNDGTKGISVDVNVDDIGASLKFATAKITRASRNNPQGQQGGGQPGQQGYQPNSGQHNGGQPANDPWATTPTNDPWAAPATTGSNEPPF